ncbi:MAG: hypothetical protein ABJH05_04335 [Fulvivirga sp.]
MEQPLKQGKEILAFIPQREPFVMVDKLFKATEKSVRAGLTVKESLLTDNGVFQESGLIENMAQTCALFAGYKANELGKEAPVGFIASVKNVVIHRKPKVGEEIHTEIEIVNELMNMQIAMASVFDEQDQLLAGCELRIFIKED